MDISNQVRKLKLLHNALPDATSYLTRVIKNDDNSPFLTSGDLVAFDSKSTATDNLSSRKVYLYIFPQHELVAFPQGQNAFTLIGSHEIENLTSAHELILLVK